MAKVAVTDPTTGDIHWQEYTWGELLDGIRKDLVVDSTMIDTDSLNASQGRPLGRLSFSTTVTTAAASVYVVINSFYIPNAAFGLAGGMARNGNGFVVPLSGWYWTAFSCRFDVGALNNWTIATFTRNGVIGFVGSTGGDIHIVANNPDSIRIVDLVLLSRGDVLGVAVESSTPGSAAFGDVTWGNSFAISYQGPS